MVVRQKYFLIERMRNEETTVYKKVYQVYINRGDFGLRGEFGHTFFSMKKIDFCDKQELHV